MLIFNTFGFGLTLFSIYSYRKWPVLFALCLMAAKIHFIVKCCYDILHAVEWSVFHNVEAIICVITLTSLLVVHAKFIRLLGHRQSFESDRAAILSDASYAIFDGQDRVGDNILTPSTEIINFYAFDGEFIKTIDITSLSDNECKDLLRNVGLFTHKPQPVSYEVRYLPSVNTAPGLIKSTSGDFILFYDKNGNVIANYPYDKDTGEITFAHHNTFKFPTDASKEPLTFPLDLQKIHPYLFLLP